MLIINFRQGGKQLFLYLSATTEHVSNEYHSLRFSLSFPYASSVDWLFYVSFIKPQNSKTEDEDLLLPILTITKKITLRKPVYNDQLNKF